MICPACDQEHEPAGPMLWRSCWLKLRQANINSEICEHAGAIVGRQAAVSRDHGAISLPVYQCGKGYGRVTALDCRVRNKGRRCGDYVPAPAGHRRAKIHTLPCRHLGEIIEHCHRGLPELHVHECLAGHGEDGRCTRKWICAHCPNYACPDPSLPVRFDEHNLYPEVPGKRFNSSLIAWQDGYLLAFRNGWAGSNIYLAQLDAAFRVAGPCVPLNLTHRQYARYGREDPRLFWFRGRLHVSYTGVASRRGSTHVLYARLADEGLYVEQIFAPHYRGRNAWEKNHQFFEHAGELYAVYSIKPHQILHIDGERAELVHETPTPPLWRPSLAGRGPADMRGGAPPVKVGGEWWHFFHARYDGPGKPVYMMGLYTFEAVPPFRVLRLTPEPLLAADTLGETENYARVYFPAGAVRVGDHWIISAGVHDRWTDLRAFNHAELESRLVPAGEW